MAQVRSNLTVTNPSSKQGTHVVASTLKNNDLIFVTSILQTNGWLIPLITYFE